MADPREGLPAELLTLWPKLEPAFRLLRQWDRRDGIVFISADDQGLLAARQVAAALGGKTIELTDARIRKEDYDAQIGKYLDKKLVECATLFDEPVDRLCVIIPRIDTQPDWLHHKIKHACENAPRPFVLLLTCPDLEWMPDFLRSHLTECRKKGAARKSPNSD